MQKNKVLGLFLLTSLLTSCFDLGTFGGNNEYNSADPEDIEEYYKAYFEAVGTIYMCKQNGTLNSYSLDESFFSKSTINELTWEDEDYEVDYEDYIYMAIKTEKDIEVDSLSLYMQADSSLVSETNMVVYMYVYSVHTFLTLPLYNAPYYLEDPSGNITYDLDGVTPLTVDYGLENKNSASGTSSMTIKSSDFDSFTISEFNGADTIKVAKNKYIVLMFYNNTCYGRHENLTKVSFTALNLLIRAV